MGSCSASGCKEGRALVYHIKMGEPWGNSTRWLCATHAFQAVHHYNSDLQRELGVVKFQIVELKNAYDQALGWLKAMHEGLVEPTRSEE